ncbi:hypothetical protein JHC09_10250 [Devosia sp. MC532]|uniref:hypothetical protein n=1 Tax=Devosia sp. MC532 TaxID=2799788 RepID=UPI0018F43AC4|nr:hypothetical protein [Devosia sp. MC532]MBJ7578264.1 hypothetical protein [Devosia sp. MC532]
MRFIIAIFLLVFPVQVLAQDGVLISCGHSEGHGYFFRDNFLNPEGPGWEEDRIGNGKISLIRLGEEWDIGFDDTIGGSSYRKDGATVIPLAITERFVMVSAILIGSYADIYTFDLQDRIVVWSSQKVGTLIPKVATLVAKC